MAPLPSSASVLGTPSLLYAAMDVIRAADQLLVAVDAAAGITAGAEIYSFYIVERLIVGT